MYFTLRSSLANAIITAGTDEYNVVSQTAFLYWVYCFKLDEHVTAVRLITAYNQGKITMEDYLKIHAFATNLE